VLANDGTQDPAISYIVECKLWERNVPREVVNSFRTVVGDAGANIGIVVSASGFQPGAVEAVKNTNIRLLTWEGFNKLFTRRWIDSFMAPRIYEAVDPLVEYTEPVNSRIFRKAEKLSESGRDRFTELRDRYGAFALFASMIGFGQVLSRLPFLEQIAADPQALIEKAVPPIVPADVALAASLREFSDRLISYSDRALAEFDNLFGERA